LVCIVDKLKGEKIPTGLEYLFRYRILDDCLIVAEGKCSSLDWVRIDARSTHVRQEFNEMFPEGWEVEFDFDKPVEEEIK
jgi:hypothetical protein